MPALRRLQAPIHHEGHLQFYLHGKRTALEIKMFQEYVNSAFVASGPRITLGAATLMKRYIRNEMRPPNYPPRRRGKGGVRSLKSGGPKMWRTPLNPAGGYAWYSGTLRRALAARRIRQTKYSSWSGVGYGRKNGYPPRWQRWGKPRQAYKYGRWIELGQGPRHRPIMMKAYNKNKMKVAMWMQLQTQQMILGVAAQLPVSKSFGDPTRVLGRAFVQ